MCECFNRYSSFFGALLTDAGKGTYPQSRLCYFFSVELPVLLEVLTSLWVLLTLPTDTYIGVGNYELGRMLYLLPLIGLAVVFLSTLEAKFQTLKSRQNNRELFLHFVALATLALCVETLTSLGYWWHSPYSEPVRALYESVWYWGRVPRP